MAELGVVVVAGAVQLFERRRAFEARAVRVRGEIVRVEHHREEDNEGKEYDAHTAIIGFHTKEGQSLTFESHRVGTSRSSVGQVVPVLYDPDDPTEARIPSAFVTWIVPALVALLGLALFALGVALPFLQ